MVSLGGFSSILIEGNFDQLPPGDHTVFTTGNTLTVAFIVQGIEKMCAQQGRDLRRSTLLVVGATGDVGSGCVRCLAPKVRRVLLYARNAERLRRLAAELESALPWKERRPERPGGWPRAGSAEHGRQGGSPPSE